MRSARLPVIGTIGKHQVIRHKLAEIALRIEAGRDITYAAFRTYLAGEDAVR